MDKIIQMHTGAQEGTDRLFFTSAAICNGSLVDNTQLTNMNVYGRIALTPLVGGLSTEIRLDFPIQSIRFGYYTFAAKGTVYYDEAVPVNQPIRTNSFIFRDYSTLSLVFFDLRDIRINDDNPLTGMGWDSLLNQKWFEVTPQSPISLELGISKVCQVEDVHIGLLKRKETQQ